MAAATQPLTRRATRCRVGPHTFAVDLTGVRGLQRTDRMAPAGDDGPLIGELPGTAGPVPVLSLARLLGVGAGPPAATAQALIADTPDGAVGFQVDQAARVFEAPAGAVAPLPRLVQATPFAGVLRGAGEPALWVEPVALLTGRGSPRPRTGKPRSGAAGGTRLLFLPLTGAASRERPWAAAVPAGQVDEVLAGGTIVPVPGAPPHVRGVIEWRDEVVAVADLAEWLGLPPVEPQAGQSVVIVTPPGSGEPVGLLVRSGVRMVELPIPHVLSRRPFRGAAAAITAAVEVGRVTVGTLDLTALAG